MSIMTYNGGAVVAMTGDKCVGIASDRRFGVRNLTLSCDSEKVFQLMPHLHVGMTGLATDSQTVLERLRMRTNLYELREQRRMRPQVLVAVISNLLYERRFAPYFVEPIVAGLDPDTQKAFVCNMDLIGCPNQPEDFVVGGSCTEQLFGMCETLWRPNLPPDQLFEIIGQALTNSVDRDAASGWGAVVTIIEPDKVTKRYLKTRMD